MASTKLCSGCKRVELAKVTPTIIEIIDYADTGLRRESIFPKNFP
jgi:hypothetical protein